MAKFLHVSSATTIPVPGGKTIDELIGQVNNGFDRFSLAHMVAPSGWEEPPQTPDFGELTLMVRGRMQVEVDGTPVVLEAGHALWVEAGCTVHYTNPFEGESEYFALCLPAFTLERAHRHDED